MMLYVKCFVIIGRSVLHDRASERQIRWLFSETTEYQVAESYVQKISLLVQTCPISRDSNQTQSN